MKQTVQSSRFRGEILVLDSRKGEAQILKNATYRSKVWNALVGGKILLKISSGESSQCNSNWFTTWHSAYPQLAGHCTGLQHGGTFSWDKNYDFTWVLSTKETEVSNSTILTSKLASVSVTFPSGCSSFPGTQQSHKLVLNTVFPLWAV